MASSEVPGPAPTGLVPPPEWHDFDLQQRIRGLPFVVRELLAGGVAGGIAKSCVAPLERVKILFQTGQMRDFTIQQTLVRVFQTEGVRGLWKGNGASVLRIVPYAAIHFGAYEHYRVLVGDALGSPRGNVPPVIDLMAGSAAGATAVILTYPLDLVRTRLAFHMESVRGGPRQTIRGVMLATVRKEGLPGLYRGVGPTIAGVLPYAGLKFYVYQSMKRAYNRVAVSKGGEEPHHRLPVVAMLTFGACSGLVAQTCTYPLDVVRRQMQVQGLREVSVPTSTSAPVVAPSSAQSPTSNPPVTNTPAAHGTSATGNHLQHANRDPPAQSQSRGTDGAGTSAAQHQSHHGRVNRHAHGGHHLNHVPRGPSPAGPLINVHLKSTLHGLVTIWRTQGWKALYSGLSINYLKVIPSTAIGFAIYDALKQYLDLPQNL
eukprot:jgi/Botrbrau1/22406/Bobra.0091s0011.1